MHVAVKLRVLDRKGRPFLGPGPVALLKGIDEVGSILAAARAMGMSYTKAHAAVRFLERSARTPLVESRIGGPGGGGSRLTRPGRAIVESYESWRAEVERYAAARFKAAGLPPRLLGALRRRR